MYALSDVNGTLCVSIRTVDNSQPRFIVSHYPTDYSVYDVIRAMDLDSLEDISVEFDRLPGYYLIRGRKWLPHNRSIDLRLTNGGKTLPIKTDFIPAAVPKVRKGTELEWQHGQWCKRTKTTREYITPVPAT